MRERRKMGALGLAVVCAFAVAGTFPARAQDTTARPDAARETIRRVQEEGRDRPDAARERGANREREAAREREANRDREAGRQQEAGREEAQRSDAEARARRAAELRRGQQEGRDLNVSHGSYMLVAHGLCMALEGSTLDALADQDPGAPTSGQLRQHARSAFASSERLFNNALREIGTARRLERRSEAAQGRDRPDAERREAGAAPAENVARGVTPTERFQGAAQDYANTLRRFAAQGGPAGAGAPAAGAAGRSGADRAAVSLINHALGEVLGGFALRHTVLMTDASGAEGRVLLQHARQMEEEGRQALRQVATAPGIASPAPAPRPPVGAAAEPAAVPAGTVVAGGVVQTLLQQARDIVQAVDELSQEARDGREPIREGRPREDAPEARERPAEPRRDAPAPAAARERDDPDRERPERDQPAQERPERDQPRPDRERPDRDQPRGERPPQPE